MREGWADLGWDVVHFDFDVVGKGVVEGKLLCCGQQLVCEISGTLWPINILFSCFM